MVLTLFEKESLNLRKCGQIALNPPTTLDRPWEEENHLRRPTQKGRGVTMPTTPASSECWASGEQGHLLARRDTDADGHVRCLGPLPTQQGVKPFVQKDSL